MSKFTYKNVSDFTLEGWFLSLVRKENGKVKYIRIAKGEGEYWVKPSKELGNDIGLDWIPGTWLQVYGQRKLDLKTGKLKLKAQRITSAVPSVQEKVVSAAKPVKKATVLVCQKSGCMKRGGTAVCQALQQALCDRGLENEVTIKPTGCLKECKAGPNIVVMPDKTRYSRIQADEIPEVIDKHFTPSVEATPHQLVAIK